MNKKNEIVVLKDWEHVLKRSSIYIGSAEISEEALPIIKDGRVIIERRDMSVGFYKLFYEVLDNAVDCAKRMKGQMKSIKVEFDSKTNLAIVTDSGNGFYKGCQKNKSSGLTNIETAVSCLRAGSNFSNDDVEESLIGTNGLGVSLVNICSSEFYIETKNNESYFYNKWINFESTGSIIKRDKQIETGTCVGFIPRKKMFKNSQWNRDILYAQMVFKKFLLKHDEVLSKLDFQVWFDGEQMDLNQPFYPQNAFVADTKIGTLIVYESFDRSGSLSFVNSAMCTGMHQRVVNESINAQLDDALGHHFYETYIVLNLPPKLVRFRDQNKTRLDSTRNEIEGIMLEHLRNKFREFFVTDLFKTILQKVEDRKMSTEIKKLRNEKKKINIKNSPKYFPPSKTIENLFIVEGECLHEDTEITIIRNNEIFSCAIRDVDTNTDLVITHNNRLRKIIGKSSKISKGIIIKTKFVDIVCSHIHKWLVYDSIKDEFLFCETKELDKDRHKLVKNKLAFINRFFEILSIHTNKPDGKYTHTILFDNDNEIGEMKATADKKICVFRDDIFKIICIKDIIKGDFLGVFD